LKVSRCANFRAHALAKWAASNRIFGSILTGSPIFSSIRIKNEKDPPCNPFLLIQLEKEKEKEKEKIKK
jgi:hypothetical protein